MGVSTMPTAPIIGIAASDGSGTIAWKHHANIVIIAAAADDGPATDA